MARNKTADLATPEQRRTERERMIAETAELYLQGMRQADIAERQQRGRTMVSNDLAAARRLWQAATIASVAELKARELHRIDILEMHYWDAWRRSIGEVVKTRTNTRRVGKGITAADATVMKETLNGNPAYLNGVQWCISERLKIVGGYAASKVALSAEEGGTMSFTIDIGTAGSGRDVQARSLAAGDVIDVEEDE